MSGKGWFTTWFLKAMSAFLLFCNCWSASATSGNSFVSEHFTIDNGLPQNTINALVLDRNGFLWIATQGGLCRFDGDRFAIYNSRNSPLPLDRVHALALDKEGNVIALSAKPDQLIYGIGNSSELYPDKHYGRLEFLFINGAPPVKIPGTVTLHSSSGNGQVKKLSGASLWKEQYRSFPVDNDRFYFAEKDTLLLVDIHHRSYLTCAVLPDWNYGEIWGDYFLSFDRRLHCQFWKEGRLLTTPPVTPAFRNLLLRIEQQQIDIQCYRNNAGSEGLLCYKSEIWLIKKQNGLLDATLLTDTWDEAQLISSALYSDKDQTLFIGTTNNGLFAFRRNDFETILHNNGEPADNTIYNQLTINDHLVVNSHFLYDPFSGTTKNLPGYSKPVFKSSFYRSADGWIWYSSGSRVAVADSNLHIRRHIRFDLEKAPEEGVIFMEDQGHKLWTCTQNTFGYIEDDQLRSLIKTPSYLDQNNANMLFSPDSTWLWIGTENGILPYNKEKGKTGDILLPGNSVKCIYRAKDGGIWIGTYGKGIYKYADGKFVALPRDPNEHLLFAHNFYEDTNGFFWIPTNNGVFQCLKAELEAYIKRGGKGSVYFYQHKNIGKYTDEFNSGNSTMVTCKNLLLVSSMRGVLSFDPLKVQPLLPNKVVLIEHVRNDGQDLHAGSQYVLPAGFKQLSIDIAAPYFGTRSNNILEYQLAEVGPEWYPVAEGRIIYNQLPKGIYHINIRKRTGFVSNNYAYQHLTFRVTPYWHETIAFRLSAFILITLAVFYFVRRRLRYLQRIKRKLEKLVDDRTSELQEAITILDNSEQELSQINQVQDRALAIILHDIQSPMYYLSLSTKFFSENLANFSAEELRQQATSIRISTHRVDKFTKDLIAWMSFNRNTQALDSVSFDIASLFQEVKELYEDMARLKNNTIVINAPNIGTITADRNKLYLVLRNLIDNANKHCRDGTIELNAIWLAPVKRLSIAVTDTGKGIPEDDKQKLLHAPATALDIQQSKLGLAMVRYYVQLINGQVDIRREDDRKTIIEIILNLE